jgi:hypothetical protein
MKTVKLLTLCAGMAMLVSCLVACEGPAGPAGPQGPAGTQGPTGAAGAAGPTGSANVVYSNWAPAGAWTRANIFGVDRFFIDVRADRLSQEIMDRGVVLVYTRLNVENQQVRQLPASIISQFTEELLDFTLRPSFIRIWSTPVRPPVTPGQDYQFRYVLIPGAQAARLNYENLSYEQAKALFNLPD